MERKNKMLKKVVSFLNEDEGATMVEYALMVALIAVVVATAVVTLEGKVSGTFTTAAGKMP
jgi:pilus assembly protein Flp/PilA